MAGEAANVQSRLARLSDERAELFHKSSTSFGLSPVEQERLGAIERELDECFLARRTERAALDARRFENDGGLLRRAIRKPGT